MLVGPTSITPSIPLTPNVSCCDEARWACEDLLEASYHYYNTVMGPERRGTRQHNGGLQKKSDQRRGANPSTGTSHQPTARAASPSPNGGAVVPLFANTTVESAPPRMLRRNPSAALSVIYRTNDAFHRQSCVDGEMLCDRLLRAEGEGGGHDQVHCRTTGKAPAPQGKASSATGNSSIITSLQSRLRTVLSQRFAELSPFTNFIDVADVEGIESGAINLLGNDADGGASPRIPTTASTLRNRKDYAAMAYVTRDSFVDTRSGLFIRGWRSQSHGEAYVRSVAALSQARSELLLPAGLPAKAPTPMPPTNNTKGAGSCAASLPQPRGSNPIATIAVPLTVAAVFRGRYFTATLMPPIISTAAVPTAGDTASAKSILNHCDVMLRLATGTYPLANANQTSPPSPSSLTVSAEPFCARNLSSPFLSSDSPFAYYLGADGRYYVLPMGPTHQHDNDEDHQAHISNNNNKYSNNAALRMPMASADTIFDTHGYDAMMRLVDGVTASTDSGRGGGAQSTAFPPIRNTNRAEEEEALLMPRLLPVADAVIRWLFAVADDDARRNASSPASFSAALCAEALGIIMAAHGFASAASSDAMYNSCCTNALLPMLRHVVPRRAAFLANAMGRQQQVSGTGGTGGGGGGGGAASPPSPSLVTNIIVSTITAAIDEMIAADVLRYAVKNAIASTVYGKRGACMETEGGGPADAATFPFVSETEKREMVAKAMEAASSDEGAGTEGNGVVVDLSPFVASVYACSLEGDALVGAAVNRILIVVTQSHHQGADSPSSPSVDALFAPILAQLYGPAMVSLLEHSSNMTHPSNTTSSNTMSTRSFSLAATVQRMGPAMVAKGLQAHFGMLGGDAINASVIGAAVGCRRALGVQKVPTTVTLPSATSVDRLANIGDRSAHWLVLMDKGVAALKNMQEQKKGPVQAMQESSKRKEEEEEHDGDTSSGDALVVLLRACVEVAQRKALYHVGRSVANQMLGGGGGQGQGAAADVMRSIIKRVVDVTVAMHSATTVRPLLPQQLSLMPLTLAAFEPNVSRMAAIMFRTIGQCCDGRGGGPTTTDTKIGCGTREEALCDVFFRVFIANLLRQWSRIVGVQFEHAEQGALLAYWTRAAVNDGYEALRAYLSIPLDTIAAVAEELGGGSGGAHDTDPSSPTGAFPASSVTTTTAPPHQQPRRVRRLCLLPSMADCAVHLWHDMLGAAAHHPCLHYVSLPLIYDDFIVPMLDRGGEGYATNDNKNSNPMRSAGGDGSGISPSPCPPSLLGLEPIVRAIAVSHLSAGRDVFENALRSNENGASSVPTPHTLLTMFRPGCLVHPAVAEGCLITVFRRLCGRCLGSGDVMAHTTLSFNTSDLPYFYGLVGLLLTQQRPAGASYAAAVAVAIASALGMLEPHNYSSTRNGVPLHHGNNASISTSANLASASAFPASPSSSSSSSASSPAKALLPVFAVIASSLTAMADAQAVNRQLFEECSDAALMGHLTHALMLMEKHIGTLTKEVGSSPSDASSHHDNDHEYRQQLAQRLVRLDIAHALADIIRYFVEEALPMFMAKGAAQYFEEMRNAEVVVVVMDQTMLGGTHRDELHGFDSPASPTSTAAASPASPTGASTSSSVAAANAIGAMVLRVGDGAAVGTSSTSLLAGIMASAASPKALTLSTMNPPPASPTVVPVHEAFRSPLCRSIEGGLLMLRAGKAGVTEEDLAFEPVHADGEDTNEENGEEGANTDEEEVMEGANGSHNPFGRCPLQSPLHYTLVVGDIAAATAAAAQIRNTITPAAAPNAAKNASVSALAASPWDVVVGGSAAAFSPSPAAAALQLMSGTSWVGSDYVFPSSPAAYSFGASIFALSAHHRLNNNCGPVPPPAKGPSVGRGPQPLDAKALSTTTSAAKTKGGRRPISGGGSASAMRTPIAAYIAATARRMGAVGGSGRGLPPLAPRPAVAASPASAAAVTPPPDGSTPTADGALDDDDLAAALLGDSLFTDMAISLFTSRSELRNTVRTASSQSQNATAAHPQQRRMQDQEQQTDPRHHVNASTSMGGMHSSGAAGGDVANINTASSPTAAAGGGGGVASSFLAASSNAMGSWGVVGGGSVQTPLGAGRQQLNANSDGWSSLPKAPATAASSVNANGGGGDGTAHASGAWPPPPTRSAMNALVATPSSSGPLSLQSPPRKGAAAAAEEEGGAAEGGVDTTTPATVDTTVGRRGDVAPLAKDLSLVLASSGLQQHNTDTDGGMGMLVMDGSVAKDSALVHSPPPPAALMARLDEFAQSQCSSGGCDDGVGESNEEGSSITAADDDSAAPPPHAIALLPPRDDTMKSPRAVAVVGDRLSSSVAGGSSAAAPTTTTTTAANTILCLRRHVPTSALAGYSTLGSTSSASAAAYSHSSKFTVISTRTNGVVNPHPAGGPQPLITISSADSSASSRDAPPPLTAHPSLPPPLLLAVNAAVNAAAMQSGSASLQQHSHTHVPRPSDHGEVSALNNTIPAPIGGAVGDDDANGGCPIPDDVAKPVKPTDGDDSRGGAIILPAPLLYEEGHSEKYAVRLGPSSAGDAKNSRPSLDISSDAGTGTGTGANTSVVSINNKSSPNDAPPRPAGGNPTRNLYAMGSLRNAHVGTSTPLRALTSPSTSAYTNIGAGGGSVRDGSMVMGGGTVVAGSVLFPGIVAAAPLLPIGGDHLSSSPQQQQRSVRAFVPYAIAVKSHRPGEVPPVSPVLLIEGGEMKQNHFNAPSSKSYRRTLGIMGHQQHEEEEGQVGGSGDVEDDAALGIVHDAGSDSMFETALRREEEAAMARVAAYHQQQQQHDGQHPLHDGQQQITNDSMSNANLVAEPSVSSNNTTAAASRRPSGQEGLSGSTNAKDEGGGATVVVVVGIPMTMASASQQQQHYCDSSSTHSDVSGGVERQLTADTVDGSDGDNTTAATPSAGEEAIPLSAPPPLPSLPSISTTAAAAAALPPTILVEDRSTVPVTAGATGGGGGSEGAPHTAPAEEDAASPSFIPDAIYATSFGSYSQPTPHMYASLLIPTHRQQQQPTQQQKGGGTVTAADGGSIIFTHSTATAGEESSGSGSSGVGRVAKERNGADADGLNEIDATPHRQRPSLPLGRTSPPLGDDADAASSILLLNMEGSNVYADERGFAKGEGGERVYVPPPRPSAEVVTPPPVGVNANAMEEEKEEDAVDPPPPTAALLVVSPPAADVLVLGGAHDNLLANSGSHSKRGSVSTRKRFSNSTSSAARGGSPFAIPLDSKRRASIPSPPPVPRDVLAGSGHLLNTSTSSDKGGMGGAINGTSRVSSPPPPMANQSQQPMPALSVVSASAQFDERPKTSRGASVSSSSAVNNQSMGESGGATMATAGEDQRPKTSRGLSVTSQTAQVEFRVGSTPVSDSIAPLPPPAACVLSDGAEALNVAPNSNDRQGDAADGPSPDTAAAEPLAVLLVLPAQEGQQQLLEGDGGGLAIAAADPNAEVESSPIANEHGTDVLDAVTAADQATIISHADDPDAETAPNTSSDPSPEDDPQPSHDDDTLSGAAAAMGSTNTDEVRRDGCINNDDRPTTTIIELTPLFGAAAVVKRVDLPPPPHDEEGSNNNGLISIVDPKCVAKVSAALAEDGQFLRRFLVSSSASSSAPSAPLPPPQQQQKKVLSDRIHQAASARDICGILSELPASNSDEGAAGIVPISTAAPSPSPSASPYAPPPTISIARLFNMVLRPYDGTELVTDYLIDAVFAESDRQRRRLTAEEERLERIAHGSATDGDLLLGTAALTTFASEGFHLTDDEVLLIHGRPIAYLGGVGPKRKMSVMSNAAAEGKRIGNDLLDALIGSVTHHQHQHQHQPRSEEDPLTSYHAFITVLLAKLAASHALSAVSAYDNVTRPYIGAMVVDRARHATAAAGGALATTNASGYGDGRYENTNRVGGSGVGVLSLMLRMMKTFADVLGALGGSAGIGGAPPIPLLRIQLRLDGSSETNTSALTADINAAISKGLEEWWCEDYTRAGAGAAADVRAIAEAVQVRIFLSGGADGRSSSLAPPPPTTTPTTMEGEGDDGEHDVVEEEVAPPFLSLGSAAAAVADVATALRVTLSPPEGSAHPSHPQQAPEEAVGEGHLDVDVPPPPLFGPAEVQRSLSLQSHLLMVSWAVLLAVAKEGLPIDPAAEALTAGLAATLGLMGGQLARLGNGSAEEQHTAAAGVADLQHDDSHHDDGAGSSFAYEPSHADVDVGGVGAIDDYDGDEGHCDIHHRHHHNELAAEERMAMPGPLDDHHTVGGGDVDEALAVNEDPTSPSAQDDPSPEDAVPSPPLAPPSPPRGGQRDTGGASLRHSHRHAQTNGPINMDGVSWAPEGNVSNIVHASNAAAYEPSAPFGVPTYRRPNTTNSNNHHGAAANDVSVLVAKRDAHLPAAIYALAVANGTINAMSPLVLSPHHHSSSNGSALHSSNTRSSPMRDMRSQRPTFTFVEGHQQTTAASSGGENGGDSNTASHIPAEGEGEGDQHNSSSVGVNPRSPSTALVVVDTMDAVGAHHNQQQQQHNESNHSNGSNASTSPSARQHREGRGTLISLSSLSPSGSPSSGHAVRGRQVGLAADPSPVPVVYAPTIIPHPITDAHYDHSVDIATGDCFMGNNAARPIRKVGPLPAGLDYLNSNGGRANSNTSDASSGSSSNRGGSVGGTSGVHSSGGSTSAVAGPLSPSPPSSSRNPSHALLAPPPPRRSIHGSTGSDHSNGSAEARTRVHYPTAASPMYDIKPVTTDDGRRTPEGSTAGSAASIEEDGDGYSSNDPNAIVTGATVATTGGVGGHDKLEAKNNRRVSLAEAAHRVNTPPPPPPPTSAPATLVSMAPPPQTINIVVGAE